MIEGPVIYLIGGCNGSGKTTFARAYLLQEQRCARFLNADEIARGLSPLAPEAGAFRAGKVLLNEVKIAIKQGHTFGLESTLSGRTYLRLLQRARKSGYRIKLHYLWLPSPELAIHRIKERVKKGGHNVPTSDVRRRFIRSLDQLVNVYAPIADQWAVWDNQKSPPELIANSETCSLVDLRRILLL